MLARTSTSNRRRSNAKERLNSANVGSASPLKRPPQRFVFGVSFILLCAHCAFPRRVHAKSQRRESRKAQRPRGKWMPSRPDSLQASTGRSLDKSLQFIFAPLRETSRPLTKLHNQRYFMQVCAENATIMH